MTTHAASITEAIQTAKPIKGTRYALGSYRAHRLIYVLVLDGVEVERGTKAEIMLYAKSDPNSPLGACHARYDQIRAAS